MQHAPSEGERWLSLGLLIQWLWPRLLTKTGLAFVIISSGLASMALSDLSTAQALLLRTPAVAATAYFSTLLLMALAIMGDLLASRAVTWLFKEPNPSRVMHQAAYFLTSLVGLAFTLAFIAFGTVGEDGHW